MQVTHAITRTPGVDFGRGLTSAQLGEPHLETMLAQHRRYQDMLREAGFQVETLPPLPGLPDAYFVEDAAVVLPDVAVLTRPGAASRREEAEHLRAALQAYRELVQSKRPARWTAGTSCGSVAAPTSGSHNAPIAPVASS